MMIDFTAKTIPLSLINRWTAGFDIPLCGTTNTGAQFEYQLFEELSKYIGFHGL